MKKNEVVVGGLYLAKVSGALTVVRVIDIRTRLAYGRGRDVTVYDVVNLRTSRATTFKSAAKLRGPALQRHLAALGLPS